VDTGMEESKETIIVSESEVKMTEEELKAQKERDESIAKSAAEAAVKAYAASLEPEVTAGYADVVEDEADKAARSVANSNLVKTAIHGEDANWGRILAAIGYSGIQFDPASVTIDFGNVPILGRNYAIDFSEELAKKVLSQREIVITIDLHRGDATATFWTCDLSKDYVAINANYRT